MKFLLCVVLWILPATTSRSAVMRYRKARARWNMQGKVQIHHIIPKAMANHPRLEHFDIDSFANLMFVPTNRDIDVSLNPSRIMEHNGGHPAYNIYVRCLIEDGQDLQAILRQLRQGIRRSTVPWL